MNTAKFYRKIGVPRNATPLHYVIDTYGTEAANPIREWSKATSDPLATLNGALL